MHIDHTILEKLEKLSHLQVAESKKTEIIKQLSEIVNYIENLNELDTDHLDASFSTLEGGTPMRDDIVATSPKVGKNILSHAPRHEDGFFVVPAIIE
ncbi:MAG: Asp-tRNA(Asn)/Glu-tRNA(Gln) amidotransferase subunit GatC [Sulfurovum sp.]|nr:Asp-tRNA(Asn)/Glu-tRNA(Gln) amidotransferase subunit GatC [Sulfurovum sp.]